MFITEAQDRMVGGKNESLILKKSSSLIQEHIPYSSKHLRPSHYRPTSTSKMNDETKTNSKRKLTAMTWKFSNISYSNSSLHPQQKWYKTVDLYNFKIHSSEKHISALQSDIQPGIQFYRLLSNQGLLEKYPIKINFPETFLVDSYGEILLIRTNPHTHLLQSEKIKKQEYYKMVKISIEKSMNQLKKYPIKYKKYYDYKQNPYAPYILTKSYDENEILFEVDFQSYKHYQDKKTKPSSNRLIQRYIYSRNMKAMIFRFCFEKNGINEQKEQYYGYRFQNIQNIFRANAKHTHIMETHKLTAMIAICYQRENKMEWSRVTNQNGLRKFMEPAKQLIQFLERVNKVKVVKIYIDFLVDLFDRPWLINLKFVKTQKNFYLVRPLSHNSPIQQVGACRVCSNTYEKTDLKKYISNKMVIQFLTHLKKRMKMEDYHKIAFLNNIKKMNSKEHITFNVCQNCYQLIAKQFQLIECERELASICNIKIKYDSMMEQEENICQTPRTLKQWRLMIYLPDIINLPIQYLKGADNLQLRYYLGKKGKIEENWTIKLSDQVEPTYTRQKTINIPLKKIKIHYFFSQSNDIDKFLKETEIFLAATSVTNSLHNTYYHTHSHGHHHNQPFASGSTSILSHFQHRYEQNLCLRQTSALLLFLSNGKYCEATIKVGLVCDGVYGIDEKIELKKINNVFFPHQSYVNSNPIPKEWMEAFGINYEIGISQYHEDQLQQEPQFQEQIQKPPLRRKKLARKTICNY